MMSVSGDGYVPAYTRSDLTNNLHGSAGFRTDTQIVIKQEIKKKNRLHKKLQKRELMTSY